MCGQFSLMAQAREIVDYYRIFLAAQMEDFLNYEEDFVLKQETAPYNQYPIPNDKVTPGMFTPVVMQDKSNCRLEWMRWGLIPSWSKDEKIAYKLINARSETIHEKLSFKNAFRQRRCLLPVSSYYEWDSNKQKYRFRMSGKTLFSLAGLWEVWQQKDMTRLYTFTIITKPASDAFTAIHERMPVIITPQQYNDWLLSTQEEVLSNLMEKNTEQLLEEII